MVNAIIYIRVSSKQQENTVSLENQEEVCKKYCRDKDYNVLGVYSDVFSAKDPLKLKNLREAINRLDRNTYLVIYKVCRFARNTRDGLNIYEKIKEKNSRLVSVTEPFDIHTTAGKAMFRNLLSHAEFESDTLSDRITAVMAYKKSIGSKLGRVPFGKSSIVVDKIRKFVHNENEQLVIDFIRKCRTRNTTIIELNQFLLNISDCGDPLEIVDEKEQVCEKIKDCLSYQNIADILNDYGVQNRGKEWTAVSVRHVDSIEFGISNVEI